MTTKKLYQEDVYRKECTSTVIDVLGTGSAENPLLLVLDATMFFPTGGGQPCDLGTINELPVAEVFEKDGIVFHKMAASQKEETNASVFLSPRFKVSDEVHCILDWDRRFEHMQRHCGEHILSGIFFRECGGVNRGFHMGDAYMTVDIDVPEISWETAERVELLTNQVIWSNAPVTTRYFEDRSEAEKLPLRKPLAVEEDISIVCVGDEANPADCVACCGTHPSSAGQVGLLKIIKLESNKGMTRVYFKAGKEALLDYQNKLSILTKLNKKYSSDDNDLLDKMKGQDEKGKEIRQELHQLKSAFLTYTIEELLKVYLIEKSKPEKKGAPEAPLPIIIREYPYFKVNDLLTISKTLTEQLNNLMVFISPSENTLVLASSGKHDCGKIIKDNAGVWRGKGGGNAGSARAMFPTKENLDCFVTFIKQAYSTN